MLAQGAVSAIRSGCEMLQQGRAIIDEFKGEAEGVVGEVTATVDELRGLWNWAVGIWNSVAGLFGVSPKEEVKFTTQENKFTTPAKKSVAKKASQSDPDPDVLQMQIVHEVSQQLGKFFDIQQQIQNHYKNLEDTSLHVYEAGQNHAIKAIERVEVELQLEEMSKKIRETMVYAPMELKDLYTRFLSMYGKIKEEQEFARQEQIAAKRYKETRKWQRHNFRIEVAMWAVALMWVLLVLWGMMLQVATLTSS
jgi:hypothetical protein